jgi:hypothetical protein
VTHDVDARAPEEDAGGGVRLDDPRRVVERDDGVERVLEHRAELPLPVDERRLRGGARQGSGDHVGDRLDEVHLVGREGAAAEGIGTEHAERALAAADDDADGAHHPERV